MPCIVGVRGVNSPLASDIYIDPESIGPVPLLSGNPVKKAQSHAGFDHFDGCVVESES